MCNRFAVEQSLQAQSEHFQTETPDPSADGMARLIYPDSMAPVVINKAGQRVITPMRWGFPPPPQASDLVTNVRNLNSAFWQDWLQTGQRCLVPVTRFCEYSDAPDPLTGRKRACWFALDQAMPLFAFAGVWRPWQGVRGTSRNKVEGSHLVFAILTTSPNGLVRPIHQKAMPVMLRPEDYSLWLEGSTEAALGLQKPWPDEHMILLPDEPQPPPRQGSLF